MVLSFHRPRVTSSHLVAESSKSTGGSDECGTAPGYFTLGVFESEHRAVKARHSTHLAARTFGARLRKRLWQLTRHHAEGSTSARLASVSQSTSESGAPTSAEAKGSTAAMRTTSRLVEGHHVTVLSKCSSKQLEDKVRQAK